MDRRTALILGKPSKIAADAGLVMNMIPRHRIYGFTIDFYYTSRRKTGTGGIHRPGDGSLLELGHHMSESGSSLALHAPLSEKMQLWCSMMEFGAGCDSTAVAAWLYRV